MKEKKLTVLALGSNLGDRQANLSRGLALLGGVMDIKECSCIYESGPILPETVSAGDGLDYYNCVLFGETELDPRELLEYCNRTENEITGQQRQKGLNLPRFLDIDIISYGDEVINQDDLHIPHLKMAERYFVLMPLADIMPQWRHPVSRKTAGMLLNEIAETQKIKKLDIKPV